MGIAGGIVIDPAGGSRPSRSSWRHGRHGPPSTFITHLSSGPAPRALDDGLRATLNLGFADPRQRRHPSGDQITAETIVAGGPSDLASNPHRPEGNPGVLWTFPLESALSAA